MVEVCAVFLLPLMARCIETIDVCISLMFVLVYGKYECLVMQMLYVCVLCASCGRSQCCILHELSRMQELGDHMDEAYSRAGLMTSL